MNQRDADWLLGRRFVADFTVAAVNATEAVLRTPEGESYVIARAELTRVIEAGLAVEAGPYESGGSS